ncbi:glycoside hydrolase family 71 protein [Auriscalpium vulgare]|uniref:Glycoside hydrolase family 71 protein n=1 Tax=Auriscalpium vulgare TaxID=40419 RepID=A0ACB8RLL2_9AGAM|nr:glycoside hydrolase family 71 protein [Auriscalpium vulgare]
MRCFTLIPFTVLTLASALPFNKHSSAFDRLSLHTRHRRITARDDLGAQSASIPASSLPATSSSAASTTVAADPTTASASSSSPLPSASSEAPPPPSTDGNPKYVVAHHMVGNTFPYTIDNWASDIALANANGIDGFALNIGSDSWQPARVADAYQAALQSGLAFKLFISFDMSALPCASPDDAAALRKYITTYANHPNQLIYHNRVFAGTFAGETCSFGQGSPAGGWASQFTQHPELTGQNAVYFVPSFFVDPNTFSTFNDAMDGALNWNSGWPIQLTADSANTVLSSVGASLSSLASAVSSTVTKTLSQFVGSTDTDTQYLNGLQAMAPGADGSPRAYMATVSPWFFTHYSPQTFNKNFIYYSDSHLYPTRWESLIDNRDKIDLVEIVTWNDYGESHYIGPIEGAQPNSQAWVDGLNHTGWLDMTKYYAEAFKTGSFPAITEDKIYMWARTHPRDADAPDPVGKPSNFQLTEDSVWAVAMTTAPATVTLSTGTSPPQTFQVPAGMTKLSTPLSAGGIMHGTIERNGQNVVDFQPDGFVFQGAPQTYNYNAFVAVSS